MSGTTPLLSATPYGTAPSAPYPSAAAPPGGPAGYPYPSGAPPPSYAPQYGTGSEGQAYVPVAVAPPSGGHVPAPASHHTLMAVAPGLTNGPMPPGYSPEGLPSTLEDVGQNCHGKGMILNTIVIGLLIALIVTGGGIFVIIPLVFFYLIYLFEACTCHTAQYLRNVLAVESAQDYANRLMAVPPVIRMIITCYHYETRTRTVTRTDSDGKTHTSFEHYTERVDTYTETNNFAYTGWRDTTPPMIGLERSEITKLNLTKNFTFGDELSRQQFELEAASLRDRNRYRDSYMDYNHVLDIAGFESRLLAFVDITKKPCFLSSTIFFFFNICALSWFYRLYVDSVCDSKRFGFTKEVVKVPSGVAPGTTVVIISG